MSLRDQYGDSITHGCTIATLYVSLNQSGDLKVRSCGHTDPLHVSCSISANQPIDMEQQIKGRTYFATESCLTTNNALLALFYK